MWRAIMCVWVSLCAAYAADDEGPHILCSKDPNFKVAMTIPLEMQCEPYAQQSQKYLAKVQSFFGATQDQTKHILLLPYGDVPSHKHALDVILGIWFENWENTLTTLQEILSPLNIKVYSASYARVQSFEASAYLRGMDGVIVWGENPLYLQHVLNTTGMAGTLRDGVLNNGLRYMGMDAGMAIVAEAMRLFRGENTQTGQCVFAKRGLNFFNYTLDFVYNMDNESIAQKMSYPCDPSIYDAPTCENGMRIMTLFTPLSRLFLNFSHSYLERHGDEITTDVNRIFGE